MFFENAEIPKLTEELHKVCEGKESVKEITETLAIFKENKVPGNDGLPTEFYQKLWHLVG